MDVLITRNMTIATDVGTTRQFVKGETVAVSLSEFGRLRRAKSAVLATVAAPSEPADDDHDGKGEFEGEALEEMTKAELLAYADAHEIDVDPKAAKAVILAKIKAEEASN